ncbi:hypothetical protein KIH31_01985 [Paenarthrobacter sp. DKR-5]|uniref:hypothetical protein n=1 Tax=Paenarthrobacter sp. DKR-5 TaxID=2835535 RepID=UPI001BDC4264|nr:hypothetical protein [Paenarthrobacter sp. DKR-5]MBT1001360.1 hypothetical protein [Paenarthrobacter sp. DKR-5]
MIKKYGVSLLVAAALALVGFSSQAAVTAVGIWPNSGTTTAVGIWPNSTTTN